MINDINLYNEGIKKVLSKNKYPELKNKTILVTGINGMIGSAIIDVLNYLNENEGYNIKILGTVRNKNKVLTRFKKYNLLTLVEYDLSKDLMLGESVDYIINAASNADPSKFAESPVETIETNFVGTKKLLEYGQKHNAQRLLYISSGEIYGQGSEEVTSFDENYRGFIDSTSPRSCYPIGKLSAESLCASFTKEYGLETVIARPSHTYGPTQKSSDSRASSQFVLNVLNHKDIIMKSEGKQIRSYTYVLDTVTGLLRILVSGEVGNAYNIANKDSTLSIKEMAESIARVGKQQVVFELPSDYEKASYNPVTRSVLNGSKLEQIGWIPCYTFQEGIEATINIMK